MLAASPTLDDDFRCQGRASIKEPFLFWTSFETCLIVGYYEGEKLYFAAKVRNGLSQIFGARFTRSSKDWSPSSVPSRNCRRKSARNGHCTKEEMKNCRWLRPELVAQIEFTEWPPETLDIRGIKRRQTPSRSCPRELLIKTYGRKVSPPRACLRCSSNVHSPRH